MAQLVELHVVQAELGPGVAPPAIEVLRVHVPADGGAANRSLVGLLEAERAEHGGLDGLPPGENVRRVLREGHVAHAARRLRLALRSAGAFAHRVSHVEVRVGDVPPRRVHQLAAPEPLQHRKAGGADSTGTFASEEERKRALRDELRALLLAAVILVYAALFQILGYFISTLLAATVILLIFRVKKIWAYPVVYAAAVAIWAGFTFLLSVRLP